MKQRKDLARAEFFLDFKNKQKLKKLNEQLELSQFLLFLLQ
jgi:hypothetical protein